MEPQLCRASCIPAIEHQMRIAIGGGQRCIGAKTNPEPGLDHDIHDHDADDDDGIDLDHDSHNHDDDDVGHDHGDADSDGDGGGVVLMIV